MAKQVKQDLCAQADVATTLAALVGSVTTYWGHSVTEVGPNRYLVVVAYDGT